MLQIRYNKIVLKSYVDGPGLRTVLFMQGCPVHCPGCQNVALWPETGGQATGVPDLAVELLTEAMMAQNYPPGGPAITISGGEPFAQAKALAYLTAALHSYGAHVIVYTGFTWEDLLIIAEADPAVMAALRYIDVLVDGPYVRQQDSPWMQYRGSINQRVIDVQASLAREREFSLSPTFSPAGGGEPEPVLLDWDAPEVVILPDGRLLAAEKVAAMFAAAGTMEPTRRCGATDGSR